MSGFQARRGSQVCAFMMRSVGPIGLTEGGIMHTLIRFVLFSAGIAACSGDGGTPGPTAASDAGGTHDAVTSTDGGRGMPRGDDASPTGQDAAASHDASGADAGANGVFAKFDGTLRTFDVTPTAQASLSSTTLVGLRITAGDGSGNTIAIQANASNLTSGSQHACGAASTNVVQAIAAGALSIHQASGATGACSITFSEVGSGPGSVVSGSFGATLVKVGGVESMVVTEGTFRAVRVN